MKKRIMLQKANKILAAVMTASMLTSTIVPGTAIYASEFTAAEVETEDGFTDGMEEETPVVTQEQEEETPEFDDGSTAENEDFAATAGGERSVSNVQDLINAVNDTSISKIVLEGKIDATSEIVINRSVTIDLAGNTIEGNGGHRIFNIKKGNNVILMSSEGKGTITGGEAPTASASDGDSFCGGAIINYGTLKIENIKITENKAPQGAGIYCSSDTSSNKESLYLENVEITKNTSYYGGAGIYCGYIVISLKNVQITDNLSGIESQNLNTTAGLYCGSGSEVLLDNVVIKKNKSYYKGSNEMGVGANISLFRTNRNDPVALKLKNKVIIMDNEAGSGSGTGSSSNLKCSSVNGNPILIDSERLSEESKIGLSVASYELKSVSPIAAIKNFKKEYFKCFSSDLPDTQKIGFKDNDFTTLYVGLKDSDLNTEINVHKWKYELAENDKSKILFYCEADEDCEYGEKQTFLQLTGEDAAYSGNPNAAVVAYGTNAEEAKDSSTKIGSIKYKRTGETGYPETEQAPTDAGTYEAKVEVEIGGQKFTLTKNFTISKVNPVIEFNEDLTYLGPDTPQPLIKEATPGMKYRVNGVDWDEIPSVTEAGTYTIHYELKGAVNYNDVEEDKTITVKRASSASLNVREYPYTGTYNGKKEHSAYVTAVKGATIKYSETDNGTYTETVPIKFKDAGTHTVYYEVTKENYETKKGKLSVEISPKNVTVTGITAEDKTYDGTNTATVNCNTATIEDVIAGDNLGVTAKGAFEQESVGDSITVKLTKLELTGDDAGNYNLLTNSSQKETHAKINKKSITVSITPNGGTYGGEIKAAEASFNDLAERDQGKITPTLLYSGTADNGTVINKSTKVPENAGTYTVEATLGEGSDNYELTVGNTAEFKIVQQSLSEDTVFVNAKAKDEFEVLVKDGKGNVLVKDADYTVKLSEKDGISTVTITGKGNYTGSIVKKITSVEKPEQGTGNIATAVTPDDDIVAAMKPSLEVSGEDAKSLLSDEVKDDTNVKEIINDKTKGSYDATIYLQMKSVTPEGVKDDVAKVEALIKEGKALPSNAKIGQNLDLQLFLTYVAKDNSKHIYSGTKTITKSDYPQKITLTIPESLKTTAAYTTRTYYVICVHNGVAEVVPSTLSGDKLSFNATKFSTYTIAYKDTYYAPSYPVTGIKVSTDKVNLTKKGETAQVKVEVTPSYADNKNLTWKSSDEKVATVDKDGKITAVGNGTATITVASVSGNYTATITVTVNDESEVKPGEIEKITIDTEAKTLTKIGESVELKVKVEPENADSSKLIWKSSNEKVAVVDKDGKVTAVGNGTATITVSTEDGKHTATVTITVKVADEPAANKTTSYGNLKARSVKQSNNSITLEWTRVSGADGYLIYGNRCNGNGKTYKYQKLATITNSKTRTWTQTGLKKGTYYKYIVKAYKLVDGKKVVTDTSVSVHAVTKGGKYGVAKAVSVTKIGSKKNTLKITLKNGKTAQITAKEVKMDKAIRHHRNLCYESSNAKVATVTPDGLIQATGKGTCSIWVYAQNGVYKTITVTVK